MVIGAPKKADYIPISNAVMPQNATVNCASDLNNVDGTKPIAPSLLNALPHYLPLGIFPLIVVAAFYGGWWLLPAFVFMGVSGPLDRALGLDGRNMDPAIVSERRLFWHNLPVWIWAFLWPSTLIFGMWQIVAANQFALWEDALLAIMLTMEGQAVFIVGHELVHRRSTWERRLGEFLLASTSYPQYATEHVYIHHAVANTGYVRSMYQMICPVLERLFVVEGGDASDGAGTGTETDEVRGDIRAHGAS